MKKSIPNLLSFCLLSLLAVPCAGQTGKGVEIFYGEEGNPGLYEMNLKRAGLSFEELEQMEMEKAKSLVAKGNVNLRSDFDGSTALHSAISAGYSRVAEYLLANGANVNARDDIGNTPLHYASRSGNLKTTKLLVKHEADINAVDDIGNTPLHKAIVLGKSFEVMEYLVEKGADTNIRGRFNNTALHEASWLGDLKAVKLLVKHGARVDIESRLGSPLNLAGKGGNQEVIDYLTEQSRKTNPLPAMYKENQKTGSQG